MFGARSPLFRMEIHNCKCCNLETRRFKVGKISCCLPSNCCFRKRKKKKQIDSEEKEEEISQVDAAVQTDVVLSVEQ